jgi:Right handed beta helix region
VKNRRARHHRQAHIAIVKPKGLALPSAPAAQAPPSISGTTYYVSPSGSDSNSGTSPGQAWRTISKVNYAPLRPGDGVLFQGGASFSDDDLMPNYSGAAGRPVVFGSYGSGKAEITHGVWFVQSHLAFENLAVDHTFFGGSETRGTSNDITLAGMSISLASGNSSLGIYSHGNHWVIENSTITNTGLSGMLLNGDGYLVTGNSITNTGLDHNNGYNNHGIYVDASDATITNNTIDNFAESAISVRYRNSTITGNTLSRGNIGIDFFQTDPVAGSAHWTGNTITHTSEAGIYICESGAAGSTMESFTIANNTIRVDGGAFMNLKPTRGTYAKYGNRLA